MLLQFSSGKKTCSHSKVTEMPPSTCKATINALATSATVLVERLMVAVSFFFTDSARFNTRRVPLRDLERVSYHIAIHSHNHSFIRSKSIRDLQILRGRHAILLPGRTLLHQLILDPSKHNHLGTPTSGSFRLQARIGCDSCLYKISIPRCLQERECLVEAFQLTLITGWVK